MDPLHFIFPIKVNKKIISSNSYYREGWRYEIKHPLKLYLTSDEKIMVQHSFLGEIFMQNVINGASNIHANFL